MKLIVPRDSSPWPTLGPQVVGFIKAHLVHGPGDLRGEPVRMDTETEGIIHRAFEIYPRDHPEAGRRRFKRVAISRRKGTAKTELAAFLAACELHPDGPVRCDGWDANGNPVGRGVRDPYLALVAYTEEQSDELAYAALYTILSEGPLADDFDIGLRRITRKAGDGRAVSLASAPDARDGARTTFQVVDESHRWTLPRLLEAHQTMLANMAKRKAADPWTLEVTTAYVPGENSIAEKAHDYASAVAEGEIADPRLFFFHRQASDTHDLDTPAGVRAAVIEASGPTAEWSDIEGIVAQWQDPTTDKHYLERVWLNRPRQSSSQAFDVARWDELAQPDHSITGDIVMGFDGAFIHDATALVGCEVKTGHIFLIGAWARPDRTRADWTVDRDAVDAAVTAAFRKYQVWAMFADPHHWEDHIARWKARHRRSGRERVEEFDTRLTHKMSTAIRGFATALEVGDLSHDGSETLRAHLANARRVDTKLGRGVDGEPLWVIRKERDDSPHKIDAAVAAVLAWEARNAAINAGVGRASVYELRGLMLAGAEEMAE